MTGMAGPGVLRVHGEHGASAWQALLQQDLDRLAAARQRSQYRRDQVSRAVRAWLANRRHARG